jgi:peptidoglycan/xylan/chitin deacetylase (PgdA/CDA1 family)
MNIVMYHYVRTFDPSIPYFKYLDRANFISQLNYFHSNGGLVGKAELDEFLEGNRQVKNKFLLTFDDGLKDHFDYVFPELEKMGAAGIFFISTLPLRKKLFLKVHKLHLIFGVNTGDQIVSWLQEEDPECFEALINNQSHNPYGLHDSPNVERAIKAFFNWSKFERSNSVISEIFNAMVGSRIDVMDFYMNAAQISEVHRAGHKVAAHGDEHIILSNHCAEEQRREIMNSLDFLSDTLGKRVTTYAIAHGLPQSYTDETLDILANLGVTCNFNVRSEPVNRIVEENRFDLPRFNCNEFKFGGVSGN